MVHGTDYLLAGLAALAAGLVNALAGGGTLITFPVLTALGLPAVAANVTSTVALCPGYLGATFAQARDLGDQKRRLRLLLPAGALGGIAGGVLLLATGERVFRGAVPLLLLLAAGLLAAQEPLRALIARRDGRAGDADPTGPDRTAPAAGPGTAALVGLAAIYGGYFGAGVSVIVLAVLALTLDDSIGRLNALKQAIALGINVAAAIFFALSSRVVWPAALVMAAAALAGGALGGRLAGWFPAGVLRWVVVLCGAGMAVVFMVRWW